MCLFVCVSVCLFVCLSVYFAVTGRLIAEDFPKIFGPNYDQPLDVEASHKVRTGGGRGWGFVGVSVSW